MKTPIHLDFISHQAAKFAVMNYHYSRRMPCGLLYRYGVWENNSFIGCVIFGRGTNKHLGKPWQLKQTQICELVRVALKTHDTPTSKIVMTAVRLLKKHNTRLEAIVSYADLDQNHIGVLYQACGWHFLGKVDSGLSFIIHGKQVHNRTLENTYWGPRRLQWFKNNVDPNATSKRSSRYKYIYRYNKNINIESQPYPKACQVGDGNHQLHSGGATPTDTLQHYAEA